MVAEVTEVVAARMAAAAISEAEVILPAVAEDMVDRGAPAGCRYAVPAGAGEGCGRSAVPRGCRGRIAFRDIAEAIGRGLNLPVVAKTPEEAGEHFGWFAHFAAIDCPASSELTQKRLGWQPKQVGLLADLERGSYFKG